MVKGPGSGREAAIRALQACGLEVVSIRDVTPVPQDVYKRQVIELNEASEGKSWKIEPLLSGNGDVTVFARGNGEGWYLKEGQTLTPVSYTHLGNNVLEYLRCLLYRSLEWKRRHKIAYRHRNYELNYTYG